MTAEEIERRTDALWHGVVIPSARPRVRVASAGRREGTKNMRESGEGRLPDAAQGLQAQTQLNAINRLTSSGRRNAHV